MRQYYPDSKTSKDIRRKESDSYPYDHRKTLRKCSKFLKI